MQALAVQESSALDVKRVFGGWLRCCTGKSEGCCCALQSAHSNVHWVEVLQHCALGSGGVAVAKVKAAPAHLHWLHSGLVAPGKLFATGYFQQNIWILSYGYLDIIQ